MLTSELQRQMEAASASGKTRQHTSCSSNPAEPTYLAEYSNGQIGTADAAQGHTVRLQYLGKALPRSTTYGPTQQEGGGKGSFASMSNLQRGLVPAQLLHLEVRALKGRTVLAEASRPPPHNPHKDTRKGQKPRCFFYSPAVPSIPSYQHPSRAPRRCVHKHTNNQEADKKKTKNSCK